MDVQLKRRWPAFTAMHENLEGDRGILRSPIQIPVENSTAVRGMETMAFRSLSLVYVKLGTRYPGLPRAIRSISPWE